MVEARSAAENGDPASGGNGAENPAAVAAPEEAAQNGAAGGAPEEATEGAAAKEGVTPFKDKVRRQRKAIEKQPEEGEPPVEGADEEPAEGLICVICVNAIEGEHRMAAYGPVHHPGCSGQTKRIA